MSVHTTHQTPDPKKILHKKKVYCLHTMNECTDNTPNTWSKNIQHKRQCVVYVLRM